MSSDIAISVKNVSKTFKIPHNKVSSLRGAFTSGVKSVFPRRRDAWQCVSTKQSKNASYEIFNALDNISFEVKKGEFFGIIGRNGSGKSTLLKILANIYQPDKGHIKINGMISPFLELGIGFNPELSGRDNVYLNATVLGMTQKQIDEKFDSIVAFSELERFIDQKLKNYSSGMQVRLAFSVSIHANRDILLMDEVLAVGDSNFQSKCLEEFNKYRDTGRTVIIVTHDIGIVQRYCDRAMLLRNGKIKMIGKAEEVANEYIRENMGDEEKRMSSVSIIPGKAEKSPQPESQSKKIAEITRVEFLDKEGNRKNVFQTGDDIVARIHYFATKKILKPVFGVAIHTRNGVDITGPNTKVSKFPIASIEGSGYIDFCIVKNPLFADDYFFTAVLYEWNCLIPFDIKYHILKFKIFSGEKRGYGILNLEHVWRKK